MPKPKSERPKRTAAIDFGLKRIGLAVSDERKIIASPLGTVQAERRLQDTAAKVVGELHQAEETGGYILDEIVVGLPLKMNGQVGLMADEVAHFVEELKKVLDLPVVMWDERLTSVQADRSMREGNMTRKKRSKHVDKIAAVLILQSYLDSKSGPADFGGGRW